MRLKDQFSNEEIKEFCKRSDAQAWFAVTVNRSIIIGSFILVARCLNPVTTALAVALLDGWQLGLGVLMHECGHGTLFKTRCLNRVVGSWLCAGAN